MDSSLRREAETAFGADFGKVRVHRDGLAASSARSLDAVAYTVGPHIVFAEGAFAPGTREGWHTLAHELSHVLQSDGSVPDAGSGGTEFALSDPGDRLEREADSIASRIERPGNGFHPGSRSAADFGNRPLNQRMLVQRQRAGNKPAPEVTEPYARGYADGWAGRPESPPAVYTEEGKKSYQRGWQLGHDTAERKPASEPSAPLTGMGPPPAPDVPRELREPPSPLTATAPANTTDVAWPPPRPGIHVVWPPLPPDTSVPAPPTDVPSAQPPAEKEAHQPAEETVPELGIDTTTQFWGIPEVSQYASTLVEGWAKRSASAHPAEKAPTKDDLAQDFDETMRGWYARRPFYVVLDHHFGEVLLRRLKDSRAKFASDLAHPKGRKPGLKGADLDAAVEAHMVVARQDLIDQVHSHLIEGAWGWMVERRNHLDFATIVFPKKYSLGSFAPARLTTTQEEDSAIRGAAAAAGKSLTADEIAKALKDAEDAKRKALTAERKAGGKTAAPVTDTEAALTDEEKQTAIAKAKLGPRAVQETRDKVQAAKLKKEQQDHWVNVHERNDQGKPKWGNVWEEDSIGVMRKTAEFILKLEKATGGGFTAANYTPHGSEGFVDRGRSVDIKNIGKREASGFFDPQVAVNFLLTLAGVADVEWRVLYDDYRVAKAVNDKLGKLRVIETARIQRNKNTQEIEDIIEHGPLVTHFHLDLAF